jgi:hypothetical protein
MRLRDWLAVAAACVVGLAALGARAADAGREAKNGPAATSAKPAAAAAPSAAASAAPQGPGEGDPSADPDGNDPDDQDEELPAGHPDVGANPHAGAGATPPGVFQPPADTNKEDPTLPPGTIVVELRDADDHPVPRETVHLGILINSIAKGDSRKHEQAPTDEQGRATFSGLETLSNIAYRVSSAYQGGSYAALPFQMSQGKSMRVVLHVYPVTRDIRGGLIVSQALVAAELRDDRIQIEEAISIYNLGRIAWQPDEVRLALPSGYTAFATQPTMGDEGVDDVKDGVRLRGTFPPGQKVIEFRWQLPWSEEANVEFPVGMPPHTAIARLMMPASADVKLTGSGMPPAELRQNAQGQSFLVTERRLSQDFAPLTTLTIGIHDLPTHGPGRIIATVLAAVGVALGILFAAMGRPLSGARKPGSNEREVLLAEIADLELAHISGDVGPRTYERARRELVDALARSLAPT